MLKLSFYYDDHYDHKFNELITFSMLMEQKFD